jgi:hypothetical protein
MGKLETFLIMVLSGASDQNILFADLCWLLKRLQFEERIRGSHHIFTRADIAEIINIQPKGKQAKAYQVKQIRTIILKYKLGGAYAE